MTRRLSRRALLAGTGSAGVGALLAACGDDARPAATTPTVAERLDAAGSCRRTAEQTEGPFYLDLDRVRRDITEGRPGTPLQLAIRVRDLECRPLPDALVDVWHADADGVYSGVDGDSGSFLRGTQVTGRDGVATFDTIYPGAYEGRTLHVHAKVHLDSRTALTTQMYFDDATSDRISYVPPDRTRNEGDGIYDPSLRLALSREDRGWLGVITFDVARS